MKLNHSWLQYIKVKQSGFETVYSNNYIEIYFINKNFNQKIICNVIPFYYPICHSMHHLHLFERLRQIGRYNRYYLPNI